MRRSRRRHSKKLYAAGYLRTPSQAGFKRHAVLAVCNVVGAAGLLGLISYSFFSERLETVAKSDAGVIEIRVERSRAVDRPPVASLFASLGPRIAEDTRDGMSGVPYITGSVAERPDRVSTPEDAVLLRASLTDGPASDGVVAASGDVRRVVIGGGEVAVRQSEPVRLASIGSIADVLPAPAPGVGRDSLSFGSLFRDDGPPARADHAATPEPAAVPLVRRGENGDVLILSFARPPSYVPEIDSETRADLIEAEEVARQTIAESDVAKDRRVARERFCLAAAIYYEARGEPRSGQEAVAQVILNRVEDPRYPGTICGVVFQNEDRRHGCQFSFACDGKPERPRPGTVWNTSLELALEFLNGHTYEPAIAATHFHADYVTPRWSRSGGMTRIQKIGRHIFYSDT